MMENGEFLSQSRCFTVRGRFFKVAIAGNFGQHDILTQEVTEADCFLEEGKTMDTHSVEEVAEYVDSPPIRGGQG